MSRPAHGADVTRRAVVAGGCACAVAALGGCATYGRAASAPAPAPAAGSAVAPLARTSDIPLGGGTVLADSQIVITQPAEGRFLAFSAVCTHQGCVVNEVADATINCPCHGSRFAIADGSVIDGPAPRPLPPRTVTVQGGELRLG